jgi:hypothetical protein
MFSSLNVLSRKNREHKHENRSKIICLHLHSSSRQPKKLENFLGTMKLENKSMTVHTPAACSARTCGGWWLGGAYKSANLRRSSCWLPLPSLALPPWIRCRAVVPYPARAKTRIQAHPRGILASSRVKAPSHTVPSPTIVWASKHGPSPSSPKMTGPPSLGLEDLDRVLFAKIATNRQAEETRYTCPYGLMVTPRLGFCASY